MRLRTLHINTQTDWGGGEHQTLLLVRGLVDRGHEAVLATRPDSPLGVRARAAGLDIFPIKPINEVDPRAIWRLARLIRATRPGIIHMHSPHALALGAIASRLAPGAGRVVSRRVARTIYRRYALRLNWLKYRLGAQSYIAVSRAVRDVLVGDGMRPEAVTVVHSGVNPATLEPFRNGAVNAEALRASHGIPPRTPIVLSIASLNRVKGPLLFTRAAARVLESRDVVFVMVGDGPMAGAVDSLARSLGITGRFIRTGFREDALAYLAASRVYVQPSLSEGLGTSILDALLLEKPVVACAVGGIPEIVDDGRHGLLVPPDDPGALAGAIVSLLDSPDLAARLGAAGRERVLAEFTSDRMVNGTLAVYLELLASTARGNGQS